MCMIMGMGPQNIHVAKHGHKHGHGYTHSIGMWISMDIIMIINVGIGMFFKNGVAKLGLALFPWYSKG